MALNDVGFLYVLANSAMPGVVKVGKTNRSPAERAAELSSATGLPTPFIVVYEQMFANCTVAERFVHTALSRQGFRVSDNREFFNAPVNDVIRAISIAPGAIGEEGDQLGVHDEDEGLLGNSQAGDELDGFSLSPAVSVAPWQSVFDEAEACYYGLGDHIQDFLEAVRLYRQAARLGCTSAYGKIADMYMYGNGVRLDNAKALEYLKEGARKGSVYCYWRMGFLFFSEAPPNCENGVKCFDLFLRFYRESNNQGKNGVSLDELEAIARNSVVLIVYSKVDGYFDLPDCLWGFFAEIRGQIKMEGKGLATYAAEHGNHDLVKKFETALSCLDEVLAE